MHVRYSYLPQQFAEIDSLLIGLNSELVFSHTVIEVSNFSVQI